MQRPTKRRAPRLALALVALLPAGGAIARADGPSPGVLMRRARFAIEEGKTTQAIDDLRALRKREPGSARGLESALVLADLEFTRGSPGDADATLADAERSFDGEGASELAMARGWLAVGTLDAVSASRHFARAAGATRLAIAQQLAQLGLGWAALESGNAGSASDDLKAAIRQTTEPALRFAACLTRSRLLSAAGDHRRALQVLRGLRKLARTTAYADDLELQIGLEQLTAGRPRDARNTFRRLARQAGVSSEAPAALLTLSDLRMAPRELAARIAALYASRSDRATSLTAFVARLLDRPAAADVPAAIALAEAALAGKGA